MGQLRLVDHVGEPTRRALLAAGRSVDVVAGGFLVRDGEVANCAYFVEAGLLKIVKTSLTGRVSFLGLLGAGALVGELGPLADAPRSSSLQAIEACRVVKIEKDRFEELLATDGELSRALLTEMAERLRDATSHLHDLMSADATTRLASRLVVLADEKDDLAGSTHLVLPVSQQEIGEWAGLSRAGAVKAIRRLREARMIETARMSITITDLDRLRAEAMP